MVSFNLNTAFTEQDLQRFFASGSNVVVAKPNGGGAPNVAWLVYRPLINNTITWEEQYGIYASNTDIARGGAVLNQISKSEFPAVGGKTYSLNPAGSFTAPQSGGGARGSYYAVNEYDNDKKYLTFGLYQNATVNGDPAMGNAVSAAPVLYLSTAEMTPFTTVYLWIQSQVVSNTVITTVTSPMSHATFGGSVTSVSLDYDPSTGTFITAGDTDAESIQLGHIEPALL
ncbi:hypothetical protein [Amycolatopsis sp. cmx-4-68]|uniref:hypothetical protein n=1 Tax=Amycolatopsis sp. cmx-4-68 TaxID=2790938 RepID=UPI00397B4EFB